MKVCVCGGGGGGDGGGSGEGGGVKGITFKALTTCFSEF